MNINDKNKKLVINFKPIQVVLIASNSEECIKNTIESWRNVASRFFIYLNNSTDGTEQIIKNLQQKYDIKYEKGPFIDFEYARNKCLELSYSVRYMYTIMIDDSYEFRGKPSLFKEELFALRAKYACMNIKIVQKTNLNEFEYVSKRIMLTVLKLKYKGKIHEELQCNVYYTMKNGWIEDVVYTKHIERTKNRKIQDLEILKNSNEPRDLFYKANTMYHLFVSSGIFTLDDVVQAYKKRIDCGDTDHEEIAQSMIFIGHLTHDPIWYIKASINWPDRLAECYLFAYTITNNFNFIKIAYNKKTLPQKSRLSYDKLVYLEYIDYYFFYELHKKIMKCIINEHHKRVERDEFNKAKLQI